MASLEVLVTPRAATERIGRLDGGVLAVRVTRPASDGEANRAVQRLVARALGLPPSALLLVAGQRSRRKRFAIETLSQDELSARLARLGGPGD